MNGNPKVSVIVPIYKAESYLYKCIDSLLTQTLADIEILLDRITYCIQTSVSIRSDHFALSCMIDRHFCGNSVYLFKMALINMEDGFGINIVIREDLVYPVWR